LDPEAAWIKLQKISNSKSYLAFNNWMLDRLLAQRQISRLGKYNADSFLEIFQNALNNDNLDFLERFFRYSVDTFPDNEDTKGLYYRCTKIMETHRNNKNDKKVEKISNILCQSKYYYILNIKT